jgi:quercetin dioxygenase-like cupin family protein
MKHYQWDKIAKEQMNPLLARRVIHSENMTVAKVYLAKGAVVPPHAHGNEQISVILAGKLRFTFDAGEKVAVAGDVLPIPPNARHKVEALEDSEVMDIFAPARSDWISGDDAYLR